MDADGSKMTGSFDQTFSRDRSSAPDHNYEKYYRLKEGDVFVEAGAYIGRYGIIANQRVGSTGRIILIEPSPSTFQELKRNISGPTVTLVEKALWKQSGKQHFFIKESPSGHRIMPYIENLKDDFVVVEVARLSEILNELSISRVDLLAWDIEGAEMEALQGVHDCLSAKIVRNLALCFYHLPTPYIEGATHIIKSYGYEILENSEGIIYARLKT